MRERDRGPRDRASPFTVLFVLLYLGVQAGVPAVQQARDAGGRFGWEMFATLEPRPAFLIERPGGRRDTVEILRHLAFSRGDLRLDHPSVPDQLCAAYPHANAVLRIPAGGSEERFPCR